jgi:hypothetical protein
VSSAVLLAIVTGTVGLLSAGILALINSSVSARAGIDENLRAERLKSYPDLWQATEAFARWPRQNVTFASLEGLHKELRSWYFSEGGLFFSETARARYGDVQQQIDALLSRPGGAAKTLAPDRYTDLMETTSALRTALTQDLDTRRRKSYWEKRKRTRWHKKAAREAQKRISLAVGDPSPFNSAL